MKSDSNSIINSNTPVLVDFLTDRCGTCIMLASILKQVKVELGEAVGIVKSDVENNQPLAPQYHVRGVPTMIVFKFGKQLWRKSAVLQENDIIISLNSIVLKNCK